MKTYRILETLFADGRKEFVPQYFGEMYNLIEIRGKGKVYEKAGNDWITLLNDNKSSMKTFEEALSVIEFEKRDLTIISETIHLI